MILKSLEVTAYINDIAVERRQAITEIRNSLIENLPEGYEENLTSNMINYVVPHSIFPAGYHCNPKQPLPFISLANQKNFIALYHMGLYADKPMSDWFVSQYPKYSKYKLDMGKSCIRFKKVDDIPLALIAELASKISVEQYIQIYKDNLQQ